ncbi:MAG: MerR family transcriptional regulator [Candidatus Omnitrophica bacterium]|nr:MerR family transcriptional regulator [Candidatus Omnitrophota bacterium]
MRPDKRLNDFEVRIDPQAPLFVIGVASDMVGVPIWTLRKLDEMGVVTPQRVGVRTRCYSQVQIRRLSYVKYLMEERRVNISGVKMILEMEMPRG